MLFILASVRFQDKNDFYNRHIVFLKEGVLSLLLLHVIFCS